MSVFKLEAWNTSDSEETLEKSGTLAELINAAISYVGALDCRFRQEDQILFIESADGSKVASVAPEQDAPVFIVVSLRYQYKQSSPEAPLATDESAGTRKKPRPIPYPLDYRAFPDLTAVQRLFTGGNSKFGICTVRRDFKKEGPYQQLRLTNSEGVPFVVNVAELYTTGKRPVAQPIPRPKQAAPTIAEPAAADSEPTASEEVAS